MKIVNSLEEDQIIFIPDRNLAMYTQRFTRKEILPWEGFCTVHDQITPYHVRQAHNLHPDAIILVHPECRPEVIDLADHVASTSGIIRYACNSSEKEFIIGTEIGILHRLTRDCPTKKCYPLSQAAICTNMKKTDLIKVRHALLELQPRVTVPDEITYRARRAIERMLAV